MIKRKNLFNNYNKKIGTMDSNFDFIFTTISKKVK